MLVIFGSFIHIHDWHIIDASFDVYIIRVALSATQAFSWNKDAIYHLLRYRQYFCNYSSSSSDVFYSLWLLFPKDYLKSTSDNSRNNYQIEGMEPFEGNTCLCVTCSDNKILLVMDISSGAYLNHISMKRSEINISLWIRAIQHMESDFSLCIACGENKMLLVIEVLK